MLGKSPKEELKEAFLDSPELTEISIEKNGIKIKFKRNFPIKVQLDETEKE